MKEFKLTREQEKKMIKQHERMREDYRWISKNNKKLIERFNDNYVFVKNKEVMYYGSDLEELLDRIRKDGNEPCDYACEWITNHPVYFDGTLIYTGK